MGLQQQGDVGETRGVLAAIALGRERAGGFVGFAGGAVVADGFVDVAEQVVRHHLRAHLLRGLESFECLGGVLLRLGEIGAAEVQQARVVARQRGHHAVALMQVDGVLKPGECIVPVAVVDQHWQDALHHGA